MRTREEQEAWLEGKATDVRDYLETVGAIENEEGIQDYALREDICEVCGIAPSMWNAVLDKVVAIGGQVARQPFGGFYLAQDAKDRASLFAIEGKALKTRIATLLRRMKAAGTELLDLIEYAEVEYGFSVKQLPAEFQNWNEQLPFNEGKALLEQEAEASEDIRKNA